MKKISDATNGELYDADYEGGTWMYKETETRDTLNNFETASKGWAECSKMYMGRIAGFPYRTWEKVQVRRGDQRQSLSVIDFGNCRISVRCFVEDMV